MIRIQSNDSDYLKPRREIANSQGERYKSSVSLVHGHELGSHFKSVSTVMQLFSMSSNNWKKKKGGLDKRLKKKLKI